MEVRANPAVAAVVAAELVPRMSVAVTLLTTHQDMVVAAVVPVAVVAAVVKVAWLVAQPSVCGWGQVLK